MKIGLVLAVYNAMDYLQECLDPWIEFPCVEIACVHCCFKENHENQEPIESADKTHEFLQIYQKKNFIQYFEFLEKSAFEHEARNYAVKHLLEQSVDFIWTIGADEIYTIEQIHSIIKYLEKDEFTSWFSIYHKNFTFDNKIWIDGFCPPRIFRVNTPSFKLKEFFWDDDIHYTCKTTNALSSYRHFPTKNIPKNIALINHYTWLSNERSRKKVEYQAKHFAPPRGAGCSFRWNYEQNKLEFNLDYYNKVGQSLPELNYE